MAWPVGAGLAYIRDCDQRPAAAGGAAGSSRRRIVWFAGGHRTADSQGQPHLEYGSAYRQRRPTIGLPAAVALEEHRENPRCYSQIHSHVSPRLIDDVPRFP